MTDTPYIEGLDKFLGNEMTPDNMDFLKEMGASCAALGGVGLYHVEGLTPEAKEQGRALLQKDHQVYHIDDQLMAKSMDSYPILWKNPGADPEKCLIGCPHLSLRELNWWTDAILRELGIYGKSHVAISTVIAAAPKVLAQFQQDSVRYQRLRDSGVLLSGSCHEMLMNSSKVSEVPTVTNSNKLRAYTAARMFLNRDLVKIIVSGKIGG
jgi:predicted aconitase